MVSKAPLFNNKALHRFYCVLSASSAGNARSFLLDCTEYDDSVLLGFCKEVKTFC